ncbi:hypothetical protein ABGV43_26340 [Paenibacillus amylolyticus]|uniref:hypothetical protein n=1 Tax=Paenibacillus amylolyticus TaxID=1451 RepID=UPI0032425A4B
MAAYVDYKFKRGFLLDEESLRKIHDILIKRVSLHNGTIMYHLFREDAYSYKTTDVNDLINEENKKGCKIVDLNILVSTIDNKFEFSWNFSSEGSRLKIEGEDRDFVFLLSSDIKDHFNNNIATSLVSSYKILDINLPKIFMVMTLLYLMCSFFIFPSSLQSRKSVEMAINSKDILEKLNFLIKDTKLSLGFETPYFWPLLGMMLYMILDLSGIVPYVIKVLFPTNLFKIGKEKDQQEKLKKLKYNLVWGVLISFLIGAGASLFVWKITLTS